MPGGPHDLQKSNALCAEAITIFRKHNITLTKQAVVVVCAVGFIVYAIFFSNVPPLRSRIRGAVYEIYTRVLMDDTAQNQWLLARLVAQEVRRDGKIPHFCPTAVEAVIEAARQRAGQPGTLGCRFRDLGGLIRIAGDIAVREAAPLVEACHVHMALPWSLPIEAQIGLMTSESSGT